MKYHDKTTALEFKCLYQRHAKAPEIKSRQLTSPQNHSSNVFDNFLLCNISDLNNNKFTGNCCKLIIIGHYFVVTKTINL